MGRRTLVLFWGAVAAAVFFFGSSWSAAGRLGSGPHAFGNAAVMAVAVVGFGVTALIAGRITFVVGRSQRRARTTRDRARVQVKEEVRGDDALDRRRQGP